MRAEHHHFVLLRAAARDLGDGVVARLVVLAGEAGVDVQAQAHRLLALQRAHHRVVVLGHHHHRRHADRLAGLARTAAHHPDDAVVPAADRHGGDHAFLDQELVEDRPELHALAELRQHAGVATALGRQRVRQQLFQAFMIVAIEVGFLVRLVRAKFVGEQHLALELALPLLQVFLLAQLGVDRLAFHRTGGTRRPRLRQRMQRHHPRAEHLDAGVIEGPAATEILHRLVVHVGQSPLAELGTGPAVGFRHRRRIGQARADHVGQVVERRHHLRTLERFLADAPGHVEIHPLLNRHVLRERALHAANARRDQRGRQQHSLHRFPPGLAQTPESMGARACRA